MSTAERQQDQPRHWRAADLFGPDAVRSAASFLVAFGVMASCLVLADAIRYSVMKSADGAGLPAVTMWPNAIEAEIADDSLQRGEQKIKPEETRPKSTPAEKKDTTDVASLAPTSDTLNPKGLGGGGDSNSRGGVIGTGGGGSGSAGGSPYGARGGTGQDESVGKYGGTPHTQNAVKLGLDWLARHQDDDGSWNRTDFDRHCKPSEPRCPTGTVAHRAPMEPALTGLAVLCFIAANNTHQRGDFKANVASALGYLRRIQAKDGCFGNFSRGINDYMLYNHAIATFALAELMAMSGDAALREPVERAVKFLTTAQQVSGAWDYTDVKTGRYDTSVTGWVVMALKSAQAAGVEVSDGVVFRLVRFLDAVTMANGDVIYANAEPSRGRRGWSIAAVGLASHLFLGFPAQSRTARLQVNLLLEHPPDWAKMSDWKRGGTYDSIYYWYYATLALFQVGGKPWDEWNAAMKKTLLLQQRRGGCLEGSWDPDDMWGIAGGRLYSTTLNILNLEVYYRYLPLYAGGTLKTADALIRTVDKGDRADAIDAIRLLGKMGEGKARDYLVKLTRGDDHTYSLEASVALAETKDAAAIAPLLDRLRSSNQFERYRAVRALAPMVGQGLVPVFIGLLRDEKSTVARAADQALRQYAGVSFGFEPESSAEERDAAVRKWEDWWKQRQAGVTTKVEPEAPWLVVRVAVDDGLIVFHTGKAGLVEKGARCDVFRGTRFIGRVHAVRTDGAVCLSKTLDGLNAADVQEGDIVKPAS